MTRIAFLSLMMLLGCATGAPFVPATPFDRDGDRLLDTVDQCPDMPEDSDGFEDDDGCPEPDDDRDGILDVCDKCPRAPETWNGVDDGDGCPDTRAVVEREEFRLKPLVFFEAGSSRVARESMLIVDDVAKAMLANPSIELVRVKGNASIDEPSVAELSLSRAASVRDLLVLRGVAPDRLEISGDSETRPNQKNRRVEFEVVRSASPPEAPQRTDMPSGPPGCPAG